VPKTVLGSKIFLLKRLDVSEALARNLAPEEPKERHLTLAGLETEAKERRPIEAFRSNQIVINLPEDPSESRGTIVFFSSRV